MRVAQKQIGLWDKEQKRLLWRCPLSHNNKLPGLVAFERSTEHHTTVWVLYTAEGLLPVKVKIVSILTYETLHEDYPLDTLICPPRYRLTPHGSSYLLCYDKYLPPGEVIYPEMLRLWLPQEIQVTEHDNALWYGIRKMADLKRS